MLLLFILPGGDNKYVLNNKLYFAQFDDFVNLNFAKFKNIYFSSVSEMTSLYNLNERKLAWEIWQFIQRSLVGSKEEAINLATNGNIRGINFTRKDIERLYTIYGKPATAIQGRMTKKSIARADKQLGNKITDSHNEYNVCRHNSFPCHCYSSSWCDCCQHTRRSRLKFPACSAPTTSGLTASMSSKFSTSTRSSPMLT